MSKKFPKNIQERADDLLKQFEAGILHARKSHKCKYLVIEVTRSYRLLNRGNKWELMSHETYNKKILNWK